MAATILACWLAKASREKAPRTLHFFAVTKAPVRSGYPVHPASSTPRSEK